MDSEFCVSATEEALKQGTPKIFNTDQGSQYTSPRFTDLITRAGAKMSMDGKGRALDNIFVERLWRSVKYENVYIKGYQHMNEAEEGLKDYFNHYNTERPHQSLNYSTPLNIHLGDNMNNNIATSVT